VRSFARRAGKRTRALAACPGHRRQYRVDHEALDREGLEWKGAHELILLNAGGKQSDAATGLLPFEERRDTTWVGKYSIKGKSAQALVWFPDYRDTSILNLDAGAVAQLGLSTGSHLQIQVPDTGHTLVNTYGKTWDDAKRIPRPAGVSHDEFGYAALLNFQDWKVEDLDDFPLRREAAKGWLNTPSTFVVRCQIFGSTRREASVARSAPNRNLQNSRHRATKGFLPDRFGHAARVEQVFIARKHVFQPESLLLLSWLFIGAE
jgi:hypothetical protein